MNGILLTQNGGILGPIAKVLGYIMEGIFNVINYIANLCHQLTFVSRHCTCLHKSVFRWSSPPPSPPPLLIVIVKPNSTRFYFRWQQQSKFWVLMIWNLG